MRPLPGSGNHLVDWYEQEEIDRAKRNKEHVCRCILLCNCDENQED